MIDVWLAEEASWFMWDNGTWYHIYNNHTIKNTLLDMEHYEYTP